MTNFLNAAFLTLVSYLLTLPIFEMARRLHK